ncbi:MAG: T9SS type A sorting domain-containing protein [Flavobacteriales bacterium]|nr:T9SS type A sorting domain-containing protein [Flavobacteriales bacterium]
MSAVTPNSSIDILYTYEDENGCEYFDTETVFVELCDNVIEYAQVEVSLFPNPANNVLHLTSNVVMLSLDLFDVNGKHIFTRSVKGATSWTEDVHMLESGMYFMEIKTVSGDVIRRPFMVE